MENESPSTPDPDNPVSASGRSGRPGVDARARNPKLIPEWGVFADDQIVLVAFVAIFAVVVGFGLQSLLGGDDTMTAALDPVAGIEAGTGIDADALANVGSEFSISARADGNRAILTGTLATAALIDDAERRASLVAGVERVDNRLRITSENDDPTTGELESRADFDG